MKQKENTTVEQSNFTLDAAQIEELNNFKNSILPQLSDYSWDLSKNPTWNMIKFLVDNYSEDSGNVSFGDVEMLQKLWLEKYNRDQKWIQDNKKTFKYKKDRKIREEWRAELAKKVKLLDL